MLWVQSPHALGQWFQPSSSHGTHKLITQIMWQTKKYFIFIWQKIGIIFTQSHQTAIVLAVTFYLTIKGKRAQCLWLNSQVLHVLNLLAAHWLKIAALSHTLPGDSHFHKGAAWMSTHCCPTYNSVTVFGVRTIQNQFWNYFPNFQL